MTTKQELKITTALINRQYVEYRKNMWCKPIGMTMFCMDMVSMKLYWFDQTQTGDYVKVKSNTATDKLVAIIKEYEDAYFKR